MRGFLASLVVALALAGPLAPDAVAQPAYFTHYDDLKMTRTSDGVLTVEMNTAGRPLSSSPQAITRRSSTVYEIGPDRANKVVILTRAGGQWMPDIDFQSFGNVADPDGLGPNPRRWHTDA